MKASKTIDLESLKTTRHTLLNPRADQMAERHARVNWQRIRLRWIDMRLRFLGEVRRSDVIAQFAVNEITASRDLSEYREAFPENTVAAKDGKSYDRAATYKPQFEFTAREVLEALTTGHLLDTSGKAGPALQSMLPPALPEPDLDVLAALTEAIHRKRVVTIKYCSVGSGEKVRDIVPYVMANDGQRWHVRAFDRHPERMRFTDFVLTRITSAQIVAPKEKATESERNTEQERLYIPPEQKAEDDLQWMRIVELHLVPKTGLRHPKTIETEYRMQDGVLKLRVRAALAGYVLRRMNIDCSPDESLSGGEYHLWLRNRNSLVDVDNLGIAPGYFVHESKATT